MVHSSHSCHHFFSWFSSKEKGLIVTLGEILQWRFSISSHSMVIFSKCVCCQFSVWNISESIHAWGFKRSLWVCKFGWNGREHQLHTPVTFTCYGNNCWQGRALYWCDWAAAGHPFSFLVSVLQSTKKPCWKASVLKDFPSKWNTMERGGWTL